MALNINGTTGISGVDGSVSAPALTGTDSNTGITFPAADTIKFSTGGVERMAITNSGISGITAGITMADQWRITADGTLSQSSVDVFTANWERVDTDGYAQLGSGMTESSGIFTFPSTGIYQITFHMPYGRNGGSTYFGQARIETTENNSSYDLAAAGYGSFGQNFGRNTATAVFIFDVTDTSTHKVRFSGYSDNDSVRFFGGTGANLNSATFIRLGDT